MLVQRSRRWTNIKPTSGQCLLSNIGSLLDIDLCRPRGRRGGGGGACILSNLAHCGREMSSLRRSLSYVSGTVWSPPFCPPSGQAPPPPPPPPGLDRLTHLERQNKCTPHVIQPTHPTPPWIERVNPAARQ